MPGALKGPIMERRKFVIALTLVPLGLCTSAWAQGSEELKLRDALKNYQAAWNKHDVNAWAAFLTEDVWFTEARDYYERQRGRSAAAALFKSNLAESELTQEVKKVRFMPDGTASVSMREVVSHLPKTDGKYKAVFESDPVISRWRKEGNTWKMFFYTSDKGWALAELKKDGVD